MNIERERSLHELMEAYPDFYVERGMNSTEIFKKTEGEHPISISVVVLNNLQTGGMDTIRFSGIDVPEPDPEFDLDFPEAQIFTPQNNPRTYVDIRRSESGTPVAEVILPVDSRFRMDPHKILSIAKIGLEIFDAYTKAKPEEKEKYKERIQDAYGTVTPEEIEMFDNWSRKNSWGLLEGMSDLIRVIGMHPQHQMGHYKLALLVLKAGTPEIISERPNS